MTAPHTDLQRILADALDRPAGRSRATYLDCACRDDVALRARVELLITTNERAGRFLGSGEIPIPARRSVSNTAP